MLPGLLKAAIFCIQSEEKKDDARTFIVYTEHVCLGQLWVTVPEAVCCEDVE